MPSAAPARCLVDLLGVGRPPSPWIEKKLLDIATLPRLEALVWTFPNRAPRRRTRRSDMAHVLWTMDADAWAVCGILTLPHLLYAWLWMRPQDLRNIAERPVATFANLAYALKGVQFATVAYWWMQTHQGVFEWKDTNVVQVLLAAALLASGQALNVGIYRAIGKPGVYYGCRLGETVPWHDGFPFNVVRHPQYVGAVLTVWGMVSLVFRVLHPGLLGVATFWTGLYTVTALIEDYM